MRFIYFIFIVLVCFSFKVHAQYTFKGKVVSGEEAKPLQGVTLSVDKKALAVTDANGLFEFSSSSDQCTIFFSHIG